MRLANIFSNDYQLSFDIKKRVIDHLKEHDFTISGIYNPRAEFNVVIGGDGTFLRAVHESHFSRIPFVGINTGTLGFFQEIPVENLDHFLNRLTNGQFSVDQLHLLEVDVQTTTWTYRYLVVNEMAIRSMNGRVVKLDISFDNVPLIHQAADGLLASTPAGSTAYNLSAGGSILYQTLDGYQLTILSPVRSKEYKSLPASIVVPGKTICDISFSELMNSEEIGISFDGNQHIFYGLKKISIRDASTRINKIVFNPNWYWHNLKEKLI